MTIFYRPLHIDEPVLADQQEIIYISSVWTQDVVWKDCRDGWKERVSEICAVSTTWWRDHIYIYIYIGKTARNVQKRIYEYRKDIRLSNLSNTLLQISKTNHSFVFNATTMLAHIHNKRLSQILEAGAISPFLFVNTRPVFFFFFFFFKYIPFFGKFVLKSYNIFNL